jgi:adenine-specific DNA-methyltransferase
MIYGSTLCFDAGAIAMVSRSGKLAKRQLGQFLTPAHIADFMASLFSQRRREWRLLDAGAGAGSLSAALLSRIGAAEEDANCVVATGYELDAAMIPVLRRAYARAHDSLKRKGVDFIANIAHADFIESATEMIRDELFTRANASFNAAILNPPYRKINSNSRDRLLLRSVGIETSNLYAAFVALAMRLLEPGGELVAITPRSFCNGPYFRAFRQQFLRTMSLRQIHVFESRSAAFRQDGVLQESVIVHAVKSSEKPSLVLISRSNGNPHSQVVTRQCHYTDVVLPHDPHAFIHLTIDESELACRQRISDFGTSLHELGLDVSTGRVVDFRSAHFLAHDGHASAVPLIRPCHFSATVIKWPATRQKKPCAIKDVGPTRNLLVPQGNYVLVKRFTAKEERRRIVACVYDASAVPARRVGFENHLNYFHCNGKGFGMRLARGLAAYLNSTPIDVCFRQFSGHTQVNATDLRSLKYPSRTKLQQLGIRVAGRELDQMSLDRLVDEVL